MTDVTYNINTINIAIQESCILLCVFALLLLLIGTIISKRKKYFCAGLFSGIILELASSIVGIVFKGESYIVVRISNFFEFFFVALVAGLFAIFVIDALNIKDRKKKKRYFYSVIMLMVIYYITLVISQFSSWYYYIDENAVYHRGRFFFIGFIFATVILAKCLFLVHKYKNNLNKKEYLAFHIYIFFPVVGLVLTYLSYGIAWGYVTNTLSAVTLLIFLISAQVDNIKTREKEIADLQTSIMLSQIQPHFLYNSLTSIAQLCDDDSKKAKEATISFAEYLRGNMNSLKNKNISFRQEMEHINSYLELEKIRFSDLLNIELDIQEDNFYLPSLCVQPIVENAVKHGIGAKSNGGVISISSHILNNNYYEVIIEDDGVGFDTNSLEDIDDNSHIGISNVKHRLEDIEGAVFSIESEINKGTRVTIQIPRR